MDCIVHGVTMSQTRLSDFHLHLSSNKAEEASSSCVPYRNVCPGLLVILFKFLFLVIPYISKDNTIYSENETYTMEHFLLFICSILSNSL